MFLGGRGFIPPSDKVNIGIVGAGGQSMFSIEELIKLEDIQLTSIADPSNLLDKRHTYIVLIPAVDRQKSLLKLSIPVKHQTINWQNTRIFV